MLTQLHVANFALIEDMTIRLGPRLNVLSGETGAGKSIVIGAIGLLLGERAVAEHIRQGADEARIEGVFAVNPAAVPEIGELLQAAGMSDDEDLIIAREVARNGKSLARVNGRTVPVSFLKELGQRLVDLHGQHQHQSLLKPEEHLELLDGFGGEEIGRIRSAIAELYDRWQELQQTLSSLGLDAAERERRMDILAFQLKEINEARLTPGEEEELLQREKILANAEKLYAAVSRAYTAISTGDERGGAPAALSSCNEALEALTEAGRIDEALRPPAELLAGIVDQLQEVALELRDYLDKIVFEPQELAAVQERINHLRDLKRKYGATLEEILAFAETAAADLERLRNSEELAAQLKQEIDDVEKKLTAACLDLRQKREETARKLEALLKEALTDLALPRAEFVVAVTGREHFTRKGMDHVEFLFSANPGEQVKPLAKIISGGEMSRVMLALKSILAAQDRIPTLIFDEVDAGIGGVTIQAVAEKLARLGRHHQVICVTHSPQIAAMATNHFRLYKEQKGDRTLTRITELAEEERREEIARMLDGAGISEVSLQHVDELMERAARFRQRADC